MNNSKKKGRNCGPIPGGCLRGGNLFTGAANQLVLQLVGIPHWRGEQIRSAGPLSRRRHPALRSLPRGGTVGVHAQAINLLVRVVDNAVIPVILFRHNLYPMPNWASL
jgi:hypothetical protein